MRDEGTPVTNRTSDLHREPVTRSNARAVRVRIVPGEERGAANTRCIGEPWDDVQGRLWPQPLWLGRFWPSPFPKSRASSVAWMNLNHSGCHVAKTVTARVRLVVLRALGGGRSI